MKPHLATPILAALTLLVFMAGCATPEYQTKVRLIPPTDAAGRACVAGCEARKMACQSDCKSRYQACLKTIEPEIEAAYTEALARYEKDLQAYAAALRHYEMELHFGWLHRYPYGYRSWWDPWPRPYFPPPYREPAMPTREGVRAALEKKRCEADCGCLPAYDACFVGCGGERVTETVCTRNCPQAP